MDLRPITKIKISKEKWLNTKIKYEEDLYIRNILEDMCIKTYKWVNSKDDFNVITDYDSFKSEFINLLYDKYRHE